MATPMQKSNISAFLRRRSTHIYQSIIVETDEHEPEEPLLSSSDSESSLLVQWTRPWKVFVLTTSVNNYFCCGCNLTNAANKIKNYKSPINWAVEKLGGEEIAGIKKKFVSSLQDWILDFSTTISHILKFLWADAILTYLIVLVCGFISTIGFLRFPDIRSVMKKKAKEMGLLWCILLFIPTFFSIVSTRLWLSVASELQLLTTKKVHPEGTNSNVSNSDDTTVIRVKELEELKAKFKDWTTKALWFEAVLEAKPQSVIQTMLLIERTVSIVSNNSILDFLPVLLSLWSMHTVTNSIYDMVVLNFVDQTGMFAKMYGNTYTALSTLAPALFISTMRTILARSQWEQVMITLGFLGTYYLIFEVFYQLTYHICSFFSTETEKHSTFAKVYSFVLVFLFSACVALWGLIQVANTPLFTIYIIVGILSHFFSSIC